MTDIQARGYTYNNGNELLTQNGTSFAYDVNGNMTSKTDATGATRYTYNTENQLIRVDLPDGRFVEYKYDPFGRRIQKAITDTTNTTTITKYVYDREDILFELDGNNNIVTEFVHGPGIDEPIAMIRNNQTYYYHADGLGSIIAITDSTGRVVQRYEYNSFGEITYIQDPNFVQPYTYTGREYDYESGLYYYRARYYDAKLGRFLQQDPIGFNGGDVNLYSYVEQNPVNWVDPWGLLKYNRKPPYTVPPSGDTLKALECLEKCLGVPDLLVTGGAEKSGHSKGSKHYEGKACDIAGPKDLSPNECAKKCGFTHGQYEDYPGENKDHWHYQIGPGLGVPKL